MNCNKVSNLLSAFMDGELLGYEHRLIHQHLQRCAECQAEYEELLQMKRLLAAMRLKYPNKRLATSIVQRIELEADEPAAVGFGNLRVPIPAFRSRPLVYSPIIGLGLGLTVFGLLFWTHPPPSAAATEGGHRSLVIEPANLTRDELPPRVSELTNGLMRESASRPAVFERRYAEDLPDFPIAVRPSQRAPASVINISFYR